MNKDIIQNPLISVIVPVYNAEEYLPACLDSILKQDLREIEIIVIDDGSTDGSGKIADRYAKGDSRIQVIHQENAHLSASRNAGMQLATGEYIAFIDSDDWIETDMFSSMYKVAKREESDVVICSVTVEYTKDNRIYFEKVNQEYTERDQKNFYSLFVELSKLHLFNYAWNKIYRAQILRDQKLNFEVEAPFEDIAFNLQVLQSIGTISVLPNTYYHYMRRDVATIISSYRPKFLEAHKRKEEIFQSFFKQFGVDRTISDEYLYNMKVRDYRVFLYTLYRPGAKLSRKERLAIIRTEYFSSLILMEIVKKTVSEDIHQKIFRELLLHTSPLLTDFCCSFLLFLRYRLEFLYREYRTIRMRSKK
jgi:glycosyltransferase involved in cell wall biosynthesis